MSEFMSMEEHGPVYGSGPAKKQTIAQFAAEQEVQLEAARLVKRLQAEKHTDELREHLARAKELLEQEACCPQEHHWLPIVRALYDAVAAEAQRIKDEQGLNPPDPMQLGELD